MEKKRLSLDAKTISNLIVVLVGACAVFMLFHFDAVRGKIDFFLNIISPFIIGFSIAYLLNAPVRFFESKLFYRSKFKKGLAVLLVYCLALVVLAVLLQLVLPQVVESIKQIGDNFQSYLNNINMLVNNLGDILDLPDEGIQNILVTYNELIAYVSSLVSGSIPHILNWGFSLGSGLISAVVTILTAVIASVYMLLSKETLARQGKKMMFAFLKHRTVVRLLEEFRRANRIFESFIVGKLLDSAIIGVICFVFTTLLKVPFPVLVSVVVGVTNVIPFFGPFFGAVPCLMILLIVDPWSALRFGILIIALQQFDGNILGPKILGDSTGISAMWVLISIVVGGGLFGFPGMLLGVPTFAVLYMIVKDIVAVRLEARSIDEAGNPLA